MASMGVEWGHLTMPGLAGLRKILRYLSLVFEAPIL